jgi:leucyl-tRNA synthetase
MEKPEKFNHRAIDKKWQKKWLDEKTFRTTDTPAKKTKQYVLDMFPYPSGAGLHVGHPEGYIASDILARYYRAKGYDVLHPMGWDAFGLPAENYALETGTHPRITTRKNIARFKEQLQRFGFSYDWDRAVNTTDPEYYRWTQWIFLQLYHAGLAYEAEAPINWCPKDKVGLANEEVVNGKCDRCGTVVERRMLKQWFLRITKYAERLLEGLEKLDWPEHIKTLQRNWIGRSEGAEVTFTADNGQPITVFTTRPDTLFGATYLVLAPEHPLVRSITAPELRKAVVQYVRAAGTKSELERTALEKEKTGIFTGAFAENPVNGEKIPIWVADYVLSTYGTGAIMAVPAHDERDFAFAEKFGLEIRKVIEPIVVHSTTESHPEIVAVNSAFTGEGKLINSGKYTGVATFGPLGARSVIVQDLEREGKATLKVQYKLRDWVFSRQRYWGEPIPIVHCPDHGVVPVPEDQLPILLPEVERYEPTGTGESPLAGIETWVKTKCPTCGKPAKRETNTMPQWAGSSWYFYRFTDPKNSTAFASEEALKNWMPVDFYIGGAEHAVLHLLYARFWHKALFDLGHIPKSVGDEPFLKLRNQGLILGEDGEKMSKSRGNVVTPDDILDQYGADAFRCFEMFMGPLDMVKPWSMRGIVGLRRFLDRVWRMSSKPTISATTEEIERLTHQTVRNVEEDIKNLRFNTAISALMVLARALDESPALPKEEFRMFLIALSPFAPHITSELLGTTPTRWPTLNSRLLVADRSVTYVVQVNGTVRGRFEAPVDATEKHVIAMANGETNVAKFLTSKPQKVIFVPGKLVNFVVGERT